MKNENFSKFVLFLNQKTIYTFDTQIKDIFWNSFFQLRSKSELRN